MPKIPMPKGALAMLVLRVLQPGPMHGYAIAQRIRDISHDVLEAEEGSLYPALQRILLEGWVSAEWGTSDSGRRVRFYTLTRAGKKQLEREVSEYEQVTAAIQARESDREIVDSRKRRTNRRWCRQGQWRKSNCG